MFQWIWKEVLDYASDEFDKWLYDIDEYIYDKNPGPDDKLVSNTKKDLPNEKGNRLLGKDYLSWILQFQSTFLSYHLYQTHLAYHME